MSVYSSNNLNSFSFASLSSSLTSQVTREWEDFASKCSSHNIDNDIHQSSAAISEPDLLSQAPKSVRRTCHKFSKYLTENQTEQVNSREKRVLFSHKPLNGVSYLQLNQNKERHVKIEQESQEGITPKVDKEVTGNTKLTLEKQFQKCLDEFNELTSVGTAALSALMQDYKRSFIQENQLLHNIIQQKNQEINRLVQNEACLLKQLQVKSNQLKQIRILAQEKTGLS